MQLAVCKDLIESERSDTTHKPQLSKHLLYKCTIYLKKKKKKKKKKKFFFIYKKKYKKYLKL